jgi:hypothetical protein
VEPSDIGKTAIITPFGLFEFPFMSFGLCNAGQTFQRFMHKVLHGLDFVIIYLDDLLIFSTDTEEHKKHLRTIFERLREFGLVINLEKCTFGASEVTFIGHCINKDGVRPLQEKVAAIKNSSAQNQRKKCADFCRRSISTDGSSQMPPHTN